MALPELYMTIQVINYAANEGCSCVVFGNERDIYEVDLHTLNMGIYTAILTEWRTRKDKARHTKETHY